MSKLTGIIWLLGAGIWLAIFIQRLELLPLGVFVTFFLLGILYLFKKEEK